MPSSLPSLTFGGGTNIFLPFKLKPEPPGPLPCPNPSGLFPVPPLPCVSGFPSGEPSLPACPEFPSPPPCALFLFLVYAFNKFLAAVSSSSFFISSLVFVCVITVWLFLIFGLFSFFSKTSSPVLKSSSLASLSSALDVELLSTTTLVASPIAGPSTLPVPSLYIPKLISSPPSAAIRNGGFGVIISYRNKKRRSNPTINSVNKAAVALSFLLSCCCAAIILFSVSRLGC